MTEPINYKELRRLSLENQYLKSHIKHLETKLEMEKPGRKLIINNYSDLVDVFNRFFCLDMNVKARTREIVIARQMYYKFLATHTSLSLASISMTLSVNHDHSTIIHAINEFNSKYGVEKTYKLTWDKLNIFLAGKFPQFLPENLPAGINTDNLGAAI